MEGRELRRITRQNDAWLARGAAGAGRADLRPEPGRHRDQRLHAQAAGLPAGHPLSHASSGFTAGRSGSTTTTSPTSTGRCWRRSGYVVLGVNPRGSSGRGEKFATAIFAAWGEKDGEDVLAAVDWAVDAGHRRSRPAGHRRLELRRDPDQPGDHPRPPVQGRDQRRGAGQRAARLRHRPVRHGVRARAGEAVGQPRSRTSRCPSRSSTPTGS